MRRQWRTADRFFPPTDLSVRLIKVLAAGTNRLEHHLREGSVVPEFPFPHILGADVAGEVAKLGQGVDGFDIGERVIPMPGFPTDEQDYDIYPASLAPSFTLPQ